MKVLTLATGLVFLSLPALAGGTPPWVPYTPGLPITTTSPISDLNKTDFSSGGVLPSVETPKVVIQQPNEVVIQEPEIKVEPRAKGK